PGGSAGKSKRPTSLVVVVRVALVALFVTVTVTPGITAPVESFTSPVIVPRVCANTGTQRSNQVQPTTRLRRIGTAPFGLIFSLARTRLRRVPGQVKAIGRVLRAEMARSSTLWNRG